MAELGFQLLAKWDQEALHTGHHVALKAYGVWQRHPNAVMGRFRKRCDLFGLPPKRLVKPQHHIFAKTAGQRRACGVFQIGNRAQA